MYSVTEFKIALIAGIIGLVGTVIGAAATAWAAKINAHKNVEAVRGQARDQGVNEHAHWLRQQRLVSYEGFLDAWDECTRIRQERADPAPSGEGAAGRVELRRTASRMMERARRISLLGPEEVSLAAEAISKVTMENIEKEDKFGEYAESAVSRLRAQEQEVRELVQVAMPGMRSDELREVIQNIHNLERLQELYSIEELERIVGLAEDSMRESEEIHARMTAIAELGEEFTTASERFLEEFQRNIQIAEESRMVFVQKVRNAIATPMAGTGDPV
jgi:hypothetical protein